MQLEQHAAGLGGERAVVGAGRAAGVGEALGGLAALPLLVVADDQLGYGYFKKRRRFFKTSCIKRITIPWGLST